MTNKQREIALFRLMVLGPLTSRDKLNHGERKQLLRELASRQYQIPYAKHCHISEQTIERWFYVYQRGGFDALSPRQRSDKGNTCISESLQQEIIQLKQANPSRSLNTLLQLLSAQGLIAKHEFSRASLHRFLQSKSLSTRVLNDADKIERRSFVAEHAGDIWQGDVMHGPTITTSKGQRKVYLVSLLDDASRLICHNAFCFGETALDIEGVLKQALLKRGLPKKMLIDNGPAYKSGSLQMICARLGIRLVYCRPYEPAAKGKIEKWHAVFRQQFLTELALENIQSLDDLNQRLWAWVEQVYHQRPHSGLDKQTPLDRWRQDLVHIKPLGSLAPKLDEYFYHRVKRLIRKDATLSWEGQRYEVAYEYTGQWINLVIEPHQQKAIQIESLEGKPLGPVHRLDPIANNYRKRQRPEHISQPSQSDINAVEIALKQHRKKYTLEEK